MKARPAGSMIFLRGAPVAKFTREGTNAGWSNWPK